MQHESYRNAEIAAFLNANFIPIKLDRELEPALDAHLIDFVQRTNGNSGWPLNVFLTPEGYPLVGFTYMPPDAFKRFLSKLQNLWKSETQQTRDTARKALLAIMVSRQKRTETEPVVWPRLAKKLRKEALQLGDSMLGGFGQQNRFPMAPQLLALLDIQKGAPNPMLESFLVLTLDQMAELGLRDHLAGGFYRYTVDPDWQVPHYEKMLYTQALLAEVYFKAASILGKDEYKQIAVSTLDFVLAEMKGKQGAYIASFSAIDDKGIEGGYYLWSEQQIERLLPEEIRSIATGFWRLKALHENDADYLPMRGEDITSLAKQHSKSEEEIRTAIEQARGLLLAERKKRGLPVDEKELAGWNGLLLAALSEAALRTGKQRFNDAARDLRNNLLGNLWDGKNLYRAKRGRRPLGAVSLEDYAYLAYGLTRWISLSKRQDDLRLRNQLLNLAWQHFYKDNGWQQSLGALLPGMPNEAAFEDGALPSASAMLMMLSMNSDDQSLGQLAREALPATRESVNAQPFWYASHGLLFQPRLIDKPKGK
jgi:uncharacterized protein YyaL (SSP411 family)